VRKCVQMDLLCVRLVLITTYPIPSASLLSFGLADIMTMSLTGPGLMQQNKNMFENQSRDIHT